MFRKEAKVTKVTLLIDFDGTLTSRAGFETVKSDFYKTKPHTAASFVEKFEEYTESFNYSKSDTDLLMTPAAVKFMRAMLANPNVKVNIVSKNSEDYIRALLEYHRFTKDELKNLIIKSAAADKSQAVANIVINDQFNKNIDYYVFDDDEDEVRIMARALELSGVQESSIKMCHHNIGAFDWSVYQREISGLFVEEKKEENTAYASCTKEMFEALKTEKTTELFSPSSLVGRLSSKQNQASFGPMLDHLVRTELSKISDAVSREKMRELFVEIQKNSASISDEKAQQLFVLVHRLLLKVLEPDLPTNKKGNNFAACQVLISNLYVKQKSIFGGLFSKNKPRDPNEVIQEMAHNILEPPVLGLSDSAPKPKR